ncbi:VIT1/CCC1 transporter family protein [Crossiella sp. SN42]|uniref:VIT1/CCC1 transporter family protein n=1 Tax=Crossiella sp. SN42 TaxID=2944808 RepID=UPI00207C70AB|nr:VIT1/CCC1 transporter family protein [Crossiella sp. SN42]MCO1578078.1 VIT1/CCC1 transporter family protein [Crossiella sp. SN42]
MTAPESSGTGGGGGAGAGVILLSGMAGLVSGAFSMALGEYASVETQNNQVRAEVAVERAELRAHPRAEQQELGVDPTEQPSPWLAGISSFFCFAVGALFPLLPYLLGFDSLPAGLLVGGVGLVIAGAVVARFTTRPWWLNGLRQLMFGAIAAGATYLVGSLIGVSVAG